MQATYVGSLSFWYSWDTKRSAERHELRTPNSEPRTAFTAPLRSLPFKAPAGSVLSTAVTHADCPFVVLRAEHVGHGRPSVDDE